MNVDEEDEGQPTKKFRMGVRATQISICSARQPMKQRYHYNVANDRLNHHVERRNADGLLISSVASCSNLWVLIKDSGTRWGIIMSRKAGFMDQVVELDFLYPSEGIRRMWDPGIT